MLSYPQVKKWLVDQGVLSEDFRMVDKSDGNGPFIGHWGAGLPPQPAESDVDDVATAKAWHAAWRREQKADPVRQGSFTHAMLKALLVVINKRLPANRQITAQELKDEILAQMP